MKIIGHRGARGLKPENTLASMMEAMKCGVDGIEFDVRVTKDDIPILCHDADLRGDDGMAISIARNTYKEIKNHKSDLLTLDKVLDTFYKKTTLLIEIKHGQPVVPIANVIRKYGMQKILVGSFDFSVLKAVRQQFPDIDLFVNDQWSGLRSTRRAKKLDAKIIDISHRWLWSGFIKAITRRNFKLYTYNLDDPVKAKKWAEAGLSGVITNYPDRFKR